MVGGVSSAGSAAGLSSSELKMLKRTGQAECETCGNRKYVDGSNDSGVSFQTPQNISPEQSASKVYSHEREHYTRENSKAQKENKKVVSNTISVERGVCPECGKTYVSGGKTRTVTKTESNENSDKNYFAQKFYDNTVGKYFGKYIDILA